MKRNYFLVFVFLVFGIFICPELKSQASYRSKPRTNVRSIADSIKRLDSLVILNKFSDPDRAIYYASNAVKIAKLSNSPVDLSRAYTLLAMAYFMGKKDSSFYYNNLALRIADSAQLTDKLGPILFNIGMIHSAAHDYETAMTLMDSSITISNMTNDQMGVARGLIELGNIKFIVHTYDDSKKMYDSALHIATKWNLILQQSVAMANLTQFDTNERKAIQQLKRAAALLTNVPGSEEELARILINIGNKYYLTPDSAIFYNLAAIRLSSGAMPPELLMGAYNSLAYSYLDKGNYDQAEFYIRNKAIPIAKQENNFDWLSSLYDTYADIYAAKGDSTRAYKMQKLAFTMRGEAYKQIGTEEIRLISSMLDLKNKEIIIQNEKRELLIQKTRIQNMELWLAGLILLVVTSILLTFILQQRNKSRLHQEQMASARRLIEMEESEKGRTARELHDITGQLVMGINSEIENLEMEDEQSKIELQTKIKTLGNSIRRISHRMNRAMIEHLTFVELIEGQCEDVKRFSGLNVHLNITNQLPDLPQDAVLHLYRIVQEMLTNASKYALNSHVEISLTKRENTLILKYSDTGPGFEKKEKNLSGMGIMNIFERAKLIGGKANIDSAPGKGTTWEITFPLQNKESVKK